MTWTETKALVEDHIRHLAGTTATPLAEAVRLTLDMAIKLEALASCGLCKGKFDAADLQEFVTDAGQKGQLCRVCEAVRRDSAAIVTP